MPRSRPEERKNKHSERAKQDLQENGETPPERQVDMDGTRGSAPAPGREPAPEKGDARRQRPVHDGPTRPGASRHGRPGSESDK